ncbi:MAG: site-specific DNA-methyltransferase [Myxococcota bacterium]|nr:site-specific DNA-methyltransferase [Myxococcota bacterium]
MTGAARTILCEDANTWLAAAAVQPGCSFITSLPDVSELGNTSLVDWKRWFRGTAERIVTLTPEDGVAIFFQTDIKRDGVWVDKGYLVSRGAEEAGAQLLWHKIVCRAPPGTTTFGRPAYAHLLAFSRGLRADAGRSTPDVLSALGEMTWARAMGAEACVAACRYVRDHTPTRTIIDPFCGQGSVLAVANALELAAIGVELSRKRAEKAARLRWSAARGFHVDDPGRPS